MIYYVLAWLIPATIALAALYKFVSKKDTDTMLGTLLYSMYLAVGSMAMALTVISGITYAFSSSSTLPEYSAKVQSLEPTLKGSFYCKEEDMIYEGTQEIEFKHDNKKYLVNYPILETVKSAGHCSWGINPPEEGIAKDLNDGKAFRAERIETMLTKGEIPSTETAEEKKFLGLILNTLEPNVNNVASKMDVNIASSSVSIQEPAIPRVKVPTLKQSNHGEAISLSVEEVSKNISAQ